MTVYMDMGVYIDLCRSRYGAHYETSHPKGEMPCGRYVPEEAVAELIERASAVAWSCIDAEGDSRNGFQVNPDDVLALRAAIASVQGSSP